MTLFYLFGAVAVIASLLVISQRNPIYSVLLLIASFGALSGLYVMLEAPFVVVTLLNAPHEETEQDERLHAFRRQAPFRFGAVLAIALAAELTWALTKGVGETGGFPSAAVSSVQEIGKVLFTEYAFPFEVTSI